MSALASVSADDEIDELLAKCESYASKPGAFETAGSLQVWFTASRKLIAAIRSFNFGNDVRKKTMVASKARFYYGLARLRLVRINESLGRSNNSAEAFGAVAALTIASVSSRTNGFTATEKVRSKKALRRAIFYDSSAYLREYMLNRSRFQEALLGCETISAWYSASLLARVPRHEGWGDQTNDTFLNIWNSMVTCVRGHSFITNLRRFKKHLESVGDNIGLRNLNEKIEQGWWTCRLCQSVFHGEKCGLICFQCDSYECMDCLHARDAQFRSLTRHCDIMQSFDNTLKSFRSTEAYVSCTNVAELCGNARDTFIHDPQTDDPITFLAFHGQGYYSRRLGPQRGCEWKYRQHLEHRLEQLSGGICYGKHIRAPIMPAWCSEIMEPASLYHFREFKALLRDNHSFCSNDVRPMFHFPVWKNVRLSSRYTNGIHKPLAQMDLFHTRLNAPALRHVLRRLLHKRASATQDRPVPMYWNIIDPNLCTTEQCLHFADPCLVNPLQPIGDDDSLLCAAGCTSRREQWVATDILVTETLVPMSAAVDMLQLICKSKTMGGDDLPAEICRVIFAFVGKDGSTTVVPRAHIASEINWIPSGGDEENATLYHCIEKVLTLSLPMLARLRSPSFLLPGPMQVVVKSQRMYLSAGESYSGVWHVDGQHESVAAVILYYFDKVNLVGGDLEFASKRLPGTRDGVYWLYGDCTKTELQAHEVIEGLERAKIPIEEGTLVCFSNYQLVHRVLRMELASDQGENKTQNLGYRDFLAFFVIDQRRPLVSFPDIHTTSSKGVECGSTIPPRDFPSRKILRNKLLHEQLRPAGKFGFHEEVYSTGNGSAAYLGFLANGSPMPAFEQFDEMPIIAYVDALNKPPPLRRGVSWVMDESESGGVPPALLNDCSCWGQVIETDSDTGEPLVYYINAKGDISQTMPKEGVSYATQV
eukprot:g4793.t1